MTDAPADEVPRTLPSEAFGAPPGPRSVFFKVLSAAISGGLIVLLFAAIIPKVADFDGVWQSVQDMPPSVLVLMLVMALAIRVLLAEAYVVLTPGLAFFRSLVAREASSAVSNVIPGPSGTATQFLILRSWGVSAETYAQATVVVGVATNVLIFSAPGILFAVWALLGMPAATGGDHAWAFGVGALALSIVAVTVVVAVSRSVRMAAALGKAGQACVNPFRRLTGKGKVTTWPQRCVELRAGTVAHLRRHGVGLWACTFGGYALNGVLLVTCLWACGISESQMPLSLGLLLYAVGRISTVVNITPGGVGVVEIAYTAVYVSVLGESAHDSVVAGVLVYRALTYLLPIITGAIAYVVWRVMRRHELRAEEAAA